ncbi:MAG: DUF3426 domain-containing protein [Sedimenticola sp.]
MHARCPFCQTLFRIHDEQLKAANGKVHCSRCHQVFDAINNLEEGIELAERDPASVLEELLAEVELTDLPSSSEIDRSAGETLTTPPLEPSMAASDAASPSIDNLNENSRFQHDNLERFLTDTRAAIREIEPSKSTLEDEPQLPFDIPKDLPEIDASEKGLISSEEIYNRQQRPGGRTLMWTLLITLFLLLALGQLSWFGREHLMQYPEGRQLLELACRHAGCQLPVRKAIDEIIITDRSIRNHPDNSNALLVSISFSNRASHPQPYPALQLSFYGLNEQLATQRVFLPAEYLQRPADRKGVFLPGAEILVQLELEDPGKDNTGFKFDFL